MDIRTENKTIKILYAFLAVTLIFMVLQNISNPWPVILLSGVLSLSVTIRHILIYSPNRYSTLGKVTILIDILIIFIISRFDNSGSSQVYYFILIGDAAIAYSYLYTSGIAALCFIAFSFEKYISEGYTSLTAFFSGLIFSSLSFIAVLAIMSIVRYEIHQREKLSLTMYELKLRTKQLEDTYVKLKETSDDLEEMTILKERNRIAREIHDTVGHTLTTVLMEVEAGERLMERDPDLAAEKLRLAKGQVRKGLSDIRQSVSMLNTGKEILGLAASIKLLIEETMKHGNVYIKYEITELPALTEQQEKTIYRALQEGLTNGIKHGKSTAFVFKLKYENGNIKFYLEDNGTGCDKIVQGFGLTAMEQRVREAGGIISISSKYGEGFCISISLPEIKDDKNAKNQDNNS